MKKLYALLVCLSFSAFSQENKDAFCRDHASLGAIEQKMRAYENMVGVGNTSGFLGLNTGVCWWHSRFQRNASYLVQMEPKLPAPTEKEARAIIKRIISGKEIVVIPGFENFRLFTLRYRNEVTASLRKWMNTDLLINQAWTRILRGTAVMSVADFQVKMRELQETFAASRGIVYLMLQFDGPMKHSWLLTNIEKAEDGWNISIVDSQSGLFVYDVFISDEASSILPSPKFEKNRAFHLAMGNFYTAQRAVPYVYQEAELQKIQTVVKDYCAQ